MTSVRDRLQERASGLRTTFHRLPGGAFAWRVLVFSAGLVLVAGGLVLVPLPGPGWLIVFLGIGIWATEFPWAARLLTWVRAKVSAATQYVLSLPGWVRVAGSFVTVAIVVAAVGGYFAWREWWPFEDSAVAATTAV